MSRWLAVVHRPGSLPRVHRITMCSSNVALRHLFRPEKDTGRRDAQQEAAGLLTASQGFHAHIAKVKVVSSSNTIVPAGGQSPRTHQLAQCHNCESIDDRMPAL